MISSFFLPVSCPFLLFHYSFLLLFSFSLPCFLSLFTPYKQISLFFFIISFHLFFLLVLNFCPRSSLFVHLLSFYVLLTVHFSNI